MNHGISYGYPGYKVDLTSEMLYKCCDIAARLIEDVGIVVKHKKFLDAIRTRDGVKIKGGRVHFKQSLVWQNIEKFIARTRNVLEQQRRIQDDGKWKLSTQGFSMCVIDIEAELIRDATCQDLRDLIKLKDSYGISGWYPVMPQDIPPLMRAIACFKICWETSDKTKPFDYLDIRQTRYIYEMHKVMDKTFTITLCLPQPLTIDEKDLEIFLNFYSDWKRNRDIEFSILDYPMLGISKPITTTGCIAMHMAGMFGVHTLFNLFDPELEVPVYISGGFPTDLRYVCWAWGSPRSHLYSFFNSRILHKLCKLEMDSYYASGALLETGSSVMDEQSALEKMGIALVAAIQGCRSFTGLGNLCVDDIFSGVQFVIDIEIVNYIKEVIESFEPHPDILTMDGIYEMLRDVSLGKEQFLSHMDTVTKMKNILPSSNLLHREKLRGWLTHRKQLKDRAREECQRRIRSEGGQFRLPEDKQKELDKIYKKAESELAK